MPKPPCLVAVKRRECNLQLQYLIVVGMIKTANDTAFHPISEYKLSLQSIERIEEEQWLKEKPKVCFLVVEMPSNQDRFKGRNKTYECGCACFKALGIA